MIAEFHVRGVKQCRRFYQYINSWILIENVIFLFAISGLLKSFGYEISKVSSVSFVFYCFVLLVFNLKSLSIFKILSNNKIICVSSGYGMINIHPYFLYCIL